MEINGNNPTAHLQRLSGINFKIEDHHSEITGWGIMDTLGNEFGEVKDIIFDIHAKKARYIVGDIRFDKISKLALIPIGIVTLHEKECEVVMSRISAASLVNLPEYRPDKNISRAEELAIRSAFPGKDHVRETGATGYEPNQEDFYNHSHFDTGRFIKISTCKEDENKEDELPGS